MFVCVTLETAVSDLSPTLSDSFAVGVLLGVLSSQGKGRRSQVACNTEAEVLLAMASAAIGPLRNLPLYTVLSVYAVILVPSCTATASSSNCIPS
jgi:hypothetical protein